MRDAWDLETKENPRQTSGLLGVLFFGGLGGLWADRALEVLGEYPFSRCCGWRFRSYSESPFSDAKKVTQKALPRRTARSLGLGVPSSRDRSGRSGSGWLRCTYTRCVRLRRTVAALPPPDRSRNEACRRGKRSKAGSKARAKAKAKAKAKARSKDRSLRQLLQLDWVPLQEQVG